MYRAQGDVAVTALACGLTHVASIQFNHTQETWMANDGTADAVPVRGDMKQVLNGGGQEQYYPALNEYMNKGVAHVINKLKEAAILSKLLFCVLPKWGYPEQFARWRAYNGCHRYQWF